MVVDLRLDEREEPHDGLSTTAARLTNAELLSRVAFLAERERGATVELIGHLAELDARKLHLAEGYGSLFAYCTGALRLAEHAAYNRIEAARLSRRFPAVLRLLSDGSLNLSTLRLLAPHLQPDNFEGLVAEARGLGKRDVERIVARLAPRPDVAPSVRRLPAAPAAAEPACAADGPSGRSSPVSEAASPSVSPSASTSHSHSPSPSASPSLPASPSASTEPSLRTSGATPEGPLAMAPPPEAGHAEWHVDRAAHATRAGGVAGDRRDRDRGRVAPLTPERYRVQFTIGSATHDRLRRAQDLLRREIPDGNVGTIFDRALALLVEDIARRKTAAAAKPQPGVPPRPGSRHIPARVKRAVWARDGGRCAFTSSHGRRCSERTFLEFHHREPYALGGEATVANISLRCRAHNLHEKDRDFGANSPRGEFVRRKTGMRTMRPSVEARPRVAFGAGSLPPDESSPLSRRAP